jgi:predicted dehydrogenase
MSMRIGLVGCGRWGSHILRDLVALGASVHVADPVPEARRDALERGAASARAAVAELPDVDGLVVASTTMSHAAVIAELTGRGVPIFCEKPLCVDPGEAQALAARAADRLFVMDKWRYHAGVRALAELARSGRLGRVVGLQLQRLQWGHAHADVDPIWILAPHDLSIAVEILGQIPRPRSAVAERTGAGAAGLIATLGVDPWLVLEISTRHPTKRRAIRVVGTDAVAQLAGADEPIEIVGAERIAVAGPPPLRLELEAFLGHLAGGPPPRSSAAEGARTVAVIAELRALAGIA